jgi:hypothetical protein
MKFHIHLANNALIRVAMISFEKGLIRNVPVLQIDAVSAGSWFSVSPLDVAVAPEVDSF